MNGIDASMITESVIDAFFDTLKMLPFLYITYLLMEFLERNAGKGFRDKVASANKSGPIWGGLLGVIPQCGFSAAASSLYVGGIVSVGTVLAVYLSTSDEMLPILISKAASPLLIIVILASKAMMGIISGLVIDTTIRLFTSKKKTGEAIEAVVLEEEECECCNPRGNAFILALVHTFKTAFFIFTISLILNVIVGYVSEDTIATFFTSTPVVGELIAGLIGLIPNCAASVVITELYLEGIIGIGPMMSGLLVGAGAGPLILFNRVKNIKQGIGVIALLYVVGVVWGIGIELVMMLIK